MKICEENMCTACSACMNACPKSAISILPDIEGRLTAKVNDNECINCGACVKACPINKSQQSNKVINCYAAWSRNDELRKKCASGGISTSLARKVIDAGGIVYGTRYVNNQLVFYGAKTYEEIDLFKGSKYVYPYVGNVYAEIKDNLENEQLVLFVGLPCQVAGLKSFLKKECENLLTVDLLCHGTMPGKYLNDYIKSDYDNALFKGKYGSALTVTKDNKLIYKKVKECDLLFMAYAKGLLHRENCYNCKFASLNREGDITIGDFWGLDKSTLNYETKPNRVSLVLVNNEKGKKFFEESKNYIEFNLRTVEEAVPFNKQLTQPCQKHEDREKFLELYKEKNIHYALKHTAIYKIVLKNRIRRIITRILSILLPKKIKELILRR